MVHARCIEYDANNNNSQYLLNVECRIFGAITNHQPTNSVYRFLPQEHTYDGQPCTFAAHSSTPSIIIKHLINFFWLWGCLSLKLNQDRKTGNSFEASINSINGTILAPATWNIMMSSTRCRLSVNKFLEKIISEFNAMSDG